MIEIRKMKLFRGWGGSWYFQWRELFKFGEWNWINFDFCHIGFEAGTYKGAYFELIVVILGLGFYVQWYPPTESRKEFIDEMNEIISETKASLEVSEADGEQSVRE